MHVHRQGDRPVYGSGFWADSEEHAKTVIKQRKLPKEKRENAMPTDNGWDDPAHTHVEAALLNKKSRAKYNNGLHALTFLSYLATCAKVADHHVILGDGGVLHEFIHSMSHRNNDYPGENERLILAVIALELDIPGYLSKAQIEDVRRYQITLQERTAR
jgi:hypothetical protein